MKQMKNKDKVNQEEEEEEEESGVVRETLTASASMSME